MPERRSALLGVVFEAMPIPIQKCRIALCARPVKRSRKHPDMASTGKTVLNHAGRLDIWVTQVESTATTTSTTCGSNMINIAGMIHVNRTASP